MKQKSGFLTVARVNAAARFLVGLGMAALAVLLVMTAAVTAAGVDRTPGVSAVPPRIAPAPRRPPTPTITPRRVTPTVPSARFGPGPAIVRPNVYGPNCRSNCGARCQMVSCADLNTSQCLSVRQRCRLSCNSRC